MFKSYLATILVSWAALANNHRWNGLEQQESLRVGEMGGYGMDALLRTRGEKSVLWPLSSPWWWLATPSIPWPIYTGLATLFMWMPSHMPVLQTFLYIFLYRDTCHNTQDSPKSRMLHLKSLNLTPKRPDFSYVHTKSLSVSRQICFMRGGATFHDMLTSYPS